MGFKTCATMAFKELSEDTIECKFVIYKNISCGFEMISDIINVINKQNLCFSTAEYHEEFVIKVTVPNDSLNNVTIICSKINDIIKKDYNDITISFGCKV